MKVACLVVVESDKQTEQLTSQLKDERTVRRDVESRVTSLQEEVSELKEVRDETQRRATQTRQKLVEEAQKKEREAEETKKRLEVIRCASFKVHMHFVKEL